MVGDVDYLIQLSDFFSKYDEYLYNIDKSKIITTGFPRNDIILNKNNNYVFFDNIKRNKTICWFPTYRKHKDHCESNNSFPFGLPAINKKGYLNKLNDVLKK